MSAKKKKKRKKSHTLRKILLLLVFLAILAGIVWIVVNTDNPVGNAVLSLMATPTPAPTPTPVPTPTPEPTPEPTPLPTPVVLDQPYYLVVDRGANTVTVYTVAQDGTYTLPARVMVCCTDQEGRYPENGLYKLVGNRMRWFAPAAYDGEYYQYATRITDKIMFTSMPYKQLENDSINAEAFSHLGESVTTGNVWLLLEDARWIYENVDEGTPVRFITGGRRDDSIQIPELGDSLWDPTDDDPFNLDYTDQYSKPAATPWLGVTPKPTADWTGEVKNH